MAATAVKTAWKDGNLYFYDKSGNVIFYVDGANRAMVFASGAGLTAPLTIDATDIAAGAVTAAKITLAAGTVFGGTKTTNIASAVDISADGTFLVGQGAGETPAAVVMSTDVTMAKTGAVTIAAKAVTNTKIAAAAGTVLAGTKTSGDVTCVDISAAGAILVGQGAGETAAAKTLSSHVAMAATGAVTIQPAVVTNAMLANGAGVGAIVTAGLGNSASYINTADGLQTALVALNAAKARGVLCIAVIDEKFEDAGGGNQPTFLVGETDDTDLCWPAATFTNAAKGAIFCKGWLNTANKAIVVNATKAVGLGTGGLSITALALPNS